MCCFNIFIFYSNDKDKIICILKENINQYLIKNKGISCGFNRNYQKVY